MRATALRLCTHLNRGVKPTEAEDAEKNSQEKAYSKESSRDVSSKIGIYTHINVERSTAARPTH